MKEPDFDDFNGSGDCPECGDEDPYPGVYFAPCCMRAFCWGCYWRKHEKYSVPEGETTSP